MTNFNAAPRFNTNETASLQSKKFERYSLELKEEIELQCKQVFSDPNYLDTLNEKGLDLINTIDENTFYKFIDFLTHYFSGQKFGSGVFGAMQTLSPKYAILFSRMRDYIKVEVK